MTDINKSEKIANELFEQIRSGKLSGKIPSDQKVADDFGVARMTATRALNLLQERGVVIRIPRKGTFTLQKRVTEIRLNANEHFFEIFRQYLSKRHPEIELVRVRANEKSDLAVMTSLSFFLKFDGSTPTFSTARTEKLRRSGKYWDMLFNVFVKEHRVYALPYLFSPILLHYNRSIMRKLAPDFDPVTMDMDGFIKLLEKAAAGGYTGIDLLCFSQALFFNMVYGLAGHSPDENTIYEAAGLLRKIRSFCGNSFKDGGTLFTLSPRHRTYGTNFNDYDISPFPLINGKRSCPLASEALIVSSDRHDHKFLHDLCEETLSPEFQQMITANRYGIAADRSIALASLTSAKERDDYFFTEIANIAITFNDYQRETLQDISLALEDMRHGIADEDEFEKNLHEIMIRQALAEKRSRRFMELNIGSEYSIAGS